MIDINVELKFVEQLMSYGYDNIRQNGQTIIAQDMQEGTDESKSIIEWCDYFINEYNNKQDGITDTRLLTSYINVVDYFKTVKVRNCIGEPTVVKKRNRGPIKISFDALITKLSMDLYDKFESEVNDDVDFDEIYNRCKQMIPVSQAWDDAKSGVVDNLQNNITEYITNEINDAVVDTLVDQVNQELETKTVANEFVREKTSYSEVG